MIKTFLLYLLLTFVSHDSKSQGNDATAFLLLDLNYNADLDYGRIDSINQSAKGLVMLDSVFRLRNGEYTVYRFLTHSKGYLFDESGLRDINELIILKVNKNKKVVDGYYYLLQNPQMPSTCELYRETRKLRLRQKMSISKLRFKKVHQEKPDYEVCEDIPKYLTDDRELIFAVEPRKRR